MLSPCAIEWGATTNIPSLPPPFEVSAVPPNLRDFKTACSIIAVTGKIVEGGEPIISNSGSRLPNWRWGLKNAHYS